jgi:hypothetical protein
MSGDNAKTILDNCVVDVVAELADQLTHAAKR